MTNRKNSSTGSNNQGSNRGSQGKQDDKSSIRQNEQSGNRQNEQSGKTPPQGGKSSMQDRQNEQSQRSSQQGRRHDSEEDDLS